MSQKPTKSPKKPILLVQTTKVNANKPLVTYSSASPRKTTATTKQTASSPFTQVPPIGASSQKQRQKEILTTYINSSQGIESPRSPRNTNQKNISPVSSSRTSPHKDSNESLKRQINDQNRHTFQQSQLIKKLHTDLVRAELVTGNSAPNSNSSDSPNQYSNLASRLDFLVENYINQNEKLKKLEEGTAESKPSAQLDDTMKRAIQTDEVCKRELGKNYSLEELSKALQNKQTIPEVSGAVSRDITSFANELDAELGKKLREIFNDNDNDSIIDNVNRLRDSAQSSKAAENIEVNDKEDTIQKLNKQHQQDIADKDEQIKQLSDEVSNLKEQNEKQNNDIQNLNITLDNNNKEHFEAKENLERQLNQQKEELNNVYKQLEEKGIETDPQRRDRELSSRIREIFTNDQDEQIPGYVRKDVELASGIRGIFASGDDNYITESVKQLRQAAPQSQNQIDDLNRQISQLKNEVEQKQHEIENQNNQINQLREESSNKDSYANQLKDEVEQKQREIENQSNQINQLKEESSNKDSYTNQLKDEVEQKQREIESQNNKHNNEVDELKNIIKNKEAEIDNYVKSAPDSELIDNYRKEIENYKQINDQLKQEREEAQRNYANERNVQQEAIDNLRKELDDLNNSSKAEIDSLKNQLNEKTEKQRELEDKINELSSTKENPNIGLQELNDSQQKSNENENEIEKLKKDLYDSQNQLKLLQQENSQKDDIINISKGEYEKLQQRLQDFIDNAGLTKQQAVEATNKIIQLKQENDELRRQNKDFISDSEASLLAFKKENEETVNFAGQCREVLPGDNDEAKLDNARLNTNLAEGVRRKLLHNEEHGSPSIDEGLLNKIDDLIKGTGLPPNDSPKTFRKDNLYESVTNIFHPEMSEEDIKNHTAKVADAAERFYNDQNVKPALNSLFDKASGAELRDLVEQMRQDPNESIRNNAKILSDALKDDRMSVEAEGMIATTLAMFLAQIGNQQ